MSWFILGMQSQWSVLRKYLKFGGSRALSETAQSSTTPSRYFFSLIINDGCFKLRKSSEKIQFSRGPLQRVEEDNSSVSKGPFIAVPQWSDVVHSVEIVPEF